MRTARCAIALALCTWRLVPATHATENVLSDSFVVKSGIPASEVERARAEGFDMSRMHGAPGPHIVPLDESPFVGPLAQQVRQELAEQKVNGVGIARQGEVPDLRKASRMALKSRSRMAPSDRPYQSLASIRPHLRYEPISVKGTILQNVRLVEATTGGGLLDGRWTGVSRSWEVAGLGYVQLEESEYRESGGSITLIKEWVNADVNGSPGSVQTKRERRGKTLVSLDWVTDNTAFRLDLQPLDPNAVKANQEALLALARSLGG